jgi:hypothetical protein
MNKLSAAREGCSYRPFRSTSQGERGMRLLNLQRGVGYKLRVTASIVVPRVASACARSLSMAFHNCFSLAFYLRIKSRFY